MSNATQLPDSSVSPRPAGEVPDGSRFDTTLRGYDRRQVDRYTAELEGEVARVRERLAEAEQRRRVAEEHANATEGELRDLRSQRLYSDAPPPEESFGYRAEKLLRMAEHEAADVRMQASTEASAVLEQARADAEKHRHEVEQSLISRAAVLDQHAAQRTVELQDREQKLAAQISSVRAEAEQMQATAARSAEQLVREAENQAEQVRARAEQAAQWQREQSEQEVARLETMQRDVRGELGRLHDLLGEELQRGREITAAPTRPELEAAPAR